MTQSRVEVAISDPFIKCERLRNERVTFEVSIDLNRVERSNKNSI